jgi:large subunit ribosomal protein L25
MAMDQIEATARPRAGKGAARAVRREKKVPAVIYGDKKPPETIALDANELKKLYNTGSFLSTVYEISVDGNKQRVLPRDLQLDPVKDFVVHVDFLRIARGASVTVEVAVEFINEDDSPGLKRGGTLNIVRHAVELQCPADAIPDHLTVDLTPYDIGDSINISAVTLPENVVPTITDRDFTIATIAGAMAEEAEEGEEAEAEAAEGEAPAEQEAAEGEEGGDSEE